MATALALGERGVGTTGNNPSVGCIIMTNGRVIGRGWTQRGGRPHAEAMALHEAGDAAAGSTIYVSLEPCMHISGRGPACVSLLVAAKPTQIFIAIEDPDPRTAGRGIAALRQAGISVTTGVMASEARASLGGFLSRIEHSRPFVTLKLATSLDGAIALADGRSQWITGNAARAHAHVERARCDAILVGAGTVRADEPMLDVRLAGLEDRSPRRLMLGSGDAPAGWHAIRSPEDVRVLDCNNLLIEGGAATATSFLRAGLVDRLLLYRAPILLGRGIPCLGDIGLVKLDQAHGEWQLTDTRRLGNDRVEVYAKAQSS